MTATLALRRFANEDALMHAERAERRAARGQLALSVSQRAEIAYVRGEAYHALSRFPESGDHFRQYLRLSGTEPPATPTGLMLSVIGQVCRQGMHRLGLLRSLRTEAARGQTKLSAHIHTRFAEHAYFTGDSLKLVHGTLCALNQAESVGSVLKTIEAYGALAIGLGTGGLQSMARYFRDHSIALADRAGELPDQGIAQLFAAVYSFQTGNWEAARDYCRNGCAICEQLGDRFRQQSCQVIRCYTDIATGEFDNAAAVLDGFGPNAEEVDNAPVRAWVLSGKSLLDMLQGGTAVHALERMRSARDATLQDAECLLCDGLEAAACLRNGDVEEAERAAGRALVSMIEKVCTMGIALFSVSAVVEVYLALANRETNSRHRQEFLVQRARKACSALRRYAARTPICRPRAKLLAGRLALLEGNRRRAIAGFRRALAEAQQLAMPVDAAMCHLALAQTLSESAEKELHASRGRGLMRRLGAAPWTYEVDSNADAASPIAAV